MPPFVYIVCASLLLLVSYDVSVCIAFYRETNRRAPARAHDDARPPRRLAPDRVTLRHALLFLVQKANYYWQLVTTLPLLARVHLLPVKASARDVCLVILDTSLAPWVHAAPLADGGVAFTLRMEGFAFPLAPDRFDNRLVVEGRLHRTAQGAVHATTQRFAFNDLAIDTVEEQLSILAIMISSVSHPVVHSFNNRVYASHADPRMRGLDDVFLHGQYLNWCAWYWPGVLFRIMRGGQHWYRRVLAHNAELPLPTHDHASLGCLAGYSRSIRFLLAARPALARLRVQYGLPVDGEALFLCSILHATDHTSCDWHTRGRMLRHVKLPNRGYFNFIALMYYRPAQHFCTNLLRDKRGRHPLYAALYEELRAVDQDLADHVTLSISY